MSGLWSNANEIDGSGYTRGGRRLDATDLDEKDRFARQVCAMFEVPPALIGWPWLDPDPNPMPYRIRLFTRQPTFRPWFIDTFHLQPVLRWLIDWLSHP